MKRGDEFKSKDKELARSAYLFALQFAPNDEAVKAKAADDVAAWCEARGLDQLRDVQPMHVAAYIEELQGRVAAPTVKLQLAAIRMLFDWLVVGQVMPSNPASVVRGPKHSVKKGKTPVLSAEETRVLLDAINTRKPVGLRDRALIALLVFTFARVGAAVKMRGPDVYTQGRRTWVRLHEKGGKRHEMPCHHNLDEYLDAYVKASSSNGDPKSFLFRTSEGQSGTLTERPMSQVDVYRMIRRRAADAGIKTKIGCHTFRATGATIRFRSMRSSGF